jgi:nucleotide-binding universal stress UspA family protein
VSVLVDTPVARYLSVDALGGSIWRPMRCVMRWTATIPTPRNAAHLKQDDVPFDILRGEEEPVDALAEAARLADVIVLSRESELVGQLVVTGSAPLLLVPGTTPLITRLNAWRWRGTVRTNQPRRCVPRCRCCKRPVQVAVLTVGERPPPSPRSMRCNLSRAMMSRPRKLRWNAWVRSRIAGQRVARFRADLLVMGAYGHSRLREFLLGGVTRYFLELKDGPALLFAH